MLDLKMVLMYLGNQLVFKHQFYPGNHAKAHSGERNTGAISTFTEFMNENEEARECLKELGLNWSMPKDGFPKRKKR